MTQHLHSIRYGFDEPARYGLERRSSRPSNELLGRGLAQNLRVSEHVLPDVYHSVRVVVERLRLKDSYSVFVYPSPTANAWCGSGERSRVLVFVSSGAVTQLNVGELQYVIGHEIGHHVFGHHEYPSTDSDSGNLRVLELSRASEVSADRAGIVGCGSTDVAIRAMLKVASGLDESTLKVNLSSYIRQVFELRDSADGDDSLFYSTHPPFTLRVRAALRFDSVWAHEGTSGQVVGLDKVDDDINRELNNAAGVSAQRFLDTATSAAFWTVSLHLCGAGTFSIADQKQLREHFGDHRVGKLRQLLKESLSRQDALTTLQERARTKMAELGRSPLLAETRFRDLTAGFGLS